MLFPLWTKFSRYTGRISARFLKEINIRQDEQDRQGFFYKFERLVVELFKDILLFPQHAQHQKLKADLIPFPLSDIHRLNTIN